MTQFAYNNLFHSIINITLFMAIKGFTPCSGTEVLYEPETVYTPNYNQKLVDSFIYKMTALKIRCQQNIHYAQEHITEQANHHQNSASNYQIRDIM